MKELIVVLERLLAEYERATPCIDQKLVNKALEARKFAKVLAAIGLMLLVGVMPAHAWDTKENPDKYFSLGLDVSSGHLAGISKTIAPGDPWTDGGFVKGLLDLRLPLTNAVTVHAFGSSTGINNNLQFSDGNEVGVGLRVYFHD